MNHILKCIKMYIKNQWDNTLPCLTCNRLATRKEELFCYVDNHKITRWRKFCHSLISDCSSYEELS